MLSAACWSAVGTSSPAKSGPVQPHRDTNMSLVLICCASSILSCIYSYSAELKTGNASAPRMPPRRALWGSMLRR